MNIAIRNESKEKTAIIRNLHDVYTGLRDKRTIEAFRNTSKESMDAFINEWYISP